MKRLLCVLLAAIVACFAFGMTACAPSGSDGSSNGTSASAGGNSSSATPSTGDGKILVAYFSATGSTKKIAEYIQKAVNGDMFEIKPKVAYTSADLDYSDSSSRVCVEHADKNKQTVALETTTPDGWADYSVVYIGYPIWWGVSAWVVDSFVKANDFKGKTVIPFCTSASSSLGSSASSLANQANGGTWKDGKRFSSSDSENSVAAWARTCAR